MTLINHFNMDMGKRYAQASPVAKAFAPSSFGQKNVNPSVD